LAPPDPLREHDDASLVRLAAVGDRDALDVLLTRHLDRVHAICRRIVGNREDALDATQAALIDVARATAHVDESATFATGLHRAATNAAIEELARRDRAGATPPTAGPDPEGDRIDADRALEGIPAELRAPVVLRDQCDLDDARIAEVLQLPRGTVRSLVARGRAAAAARLAPGHDAAPAPEEAEADEALSALLDGELDAFAHERGTTTADVRRQLDAVPDLAARQARMEAARALVREAVPPLDDLTRHRLVRTAVRAGPRPVTSPSRRRVKVFAIAAAVLLALVSVGAVLAVAQHSDDGSSGNRGASRAPVLRGDVGDLGDVTSPATLRSLLDRRARHRGGRDAGSASATTTPGVKDCVDQLSGHRPATFSGTATYRGEPAAVVGVARGGRTIVFVVAQSSCTDVLASISR
jgi:RNA polymerase sigma-70 factor (ECF subfamily)